MGKYILKRILYMAVVFLIMSFIVFLLYGLIPGDPVRAELEPLKTQLTKEEYNYRYEQLRDAYGLNDPLLVRYGKWLGRLLKFDLGMSSKFKQAVSKVVVIPMKVTISMNIFVIIICLGITIPLGIFTAVYKNSVFDKITQVLTVIGYSIPIFIIAMVFIYIFAVKLRWFPVSGMSTAGLEGTKSEMALDRMKHFVLPVGIIIVASLGAMTRYVRAAMMSALSMDYIKTARAKGLREKVVIFSHAWRNALLPVVTLIIGWFMSIFSGSLITESMFNLNGMGKFFIDALNNKDYNVALAIQMFYILLSLFSNFISDMCYGIVDPRVKLAE